MISILLLGLEAFLGLSILYLYSIATSSSPSRGTLVVTIIIRT